MNPPDIQIIITMQHPRSWKAALYDVKNDTNMIIGWGTTPQVALQAMLSDTVVSASTIWIEKRNRQKNRKPAQTDGYIGIPKRKIS